MLSSYLIIQLVVRFFRCWKVGAKLPPVTQTTSPRAFRRIVFIVHEIPFSLIFLVALNGRLRAWATRYTLDRLNLSICAHLNKNHLQNSICSSRSSLSYKELDIVCMTETYWASRRPNFAQSLWLRNLGVRIIISLKSLQFRAFLTVLGVRSICWFHSGWKLSATD